MPEPAIKWEIAIHREVKKELSRLPGYIMRTTLDSIRALADNPYPEGSGKIQGHKSLYRIRVGDWRIIYDVDNIKYIVTILRVAGRGNAYRNL